jgi:hypothetical protein
MNSIGLYVNLPCHTPLLSSSRILDIVLVLVLVLVLAESANNVPPSITSIFLALVSGTHCQWNQLSSFSGFLLLQGFVAFQYRHALAVNLATYHSQ